MATADGGNTTPASLSDATATLKSAAVTLATTITSRTADRLIAVLAEGEMDDWTREDLSRLLRQLQTVEANIAETV